MPVYIDKASLIIRKETIMAKYPGGVERFKSDFLFDKGIHNQEDDELLMAAYMNYPYSDVELLMEKGFHYDVENKRSDDFIVLFSHFEQPWEVSWLENNKIFAWHIDCQTWQKEKVKEICSMLMEEIEEKYFAKGETPFRVIKSKSPY